jgi:Cu+-exporting ATPase
MTRRTTAHGADRIRQAGDRPPRGALLDPVCGMEVVLATAAHTLDHNGQTYAFCSASCRERFRSDPTAFPAGGRDRGQPEVGSAEPASRQSQVGATAYTCPMHPEVRAAAPGACPDCGMALEPVNLGAAR